MPGGMTMDRKQATGRFHSRTIEKRKARAKKTKMIFRLFNPFSPD